MDNRVVTLDDGTIGDLVLSDGVALRAFSKEVAELISERQFFEVLLLRIVLLVSEEGLSL